MYLFRFTIPLFSIFALNSCTSSKGQVNAFNFAERKVIILSNGDKSSLALADYFYQHLLKRNSKSNISIINTDSPRSGDKANSIYFELVPDLGFDYEIKNVPGKLSLFAKEKETMIWLIYALISQMGEKIDLDVQDLPPTFINFKTGQYNFALRYREPHLLSNTNPDLLGVFNTHSVDRDWGVWGHNFKKIFDGKIPENSLALGKEGRDKEQFCFSSKETIQAIRNYLDGQKDNGVKYFMISPNDNDVACICESCKKLGNQTGQATGAVSHLLNILAKSYPDYQFFTTAYFTTKKAPTIDMEKNTGVFVSTIDFTKSSKINLGSTSVKDFEKLVGQWKAKVNAVYLWDYVANFDDYLSPYPVLYRFQNQLRFFQSMGINGLFLNGAGYDYSPFDDIKAYVLSAIMMDPSLNIGLLVKSYCRKLYPISGDLLADYLLEIEQKSAVSRSELGIYTPFRSLMKSYLDQKKFELFYKNLSELRKKAKLEERVKLDKLLLGLNYTKLQFNYHTGTIENGFLIKQDGKLFLNQGLENSLLDLAAFSKKYNYENYKEKDGKIDTYLSEWSQIQSRPLKTNSFQVTKVVELETNQTLEEGQILSDNLPGFQSDFNQGWLLSGNDLKVSGKAIFSDPGLRTIRMRFLFNPRHRMLQPDKIEILRDGIRISTVSGKDLTKADHSFEMEKDLMIKEKEQIEVRIIKNKSINNSVIACDEIEIF